MKPLFSVSTSYKLRAGAIFTGRLALKEKLHRPPPPSRASSELPSKCLTDLAEYDSGRREGAEESRGSPALWIGRKKNYTVYNRLQGFNIWRPSVGRIVSSSPLNPSSHIANVPRSAVTTPHAWVKSASSARITGHHRTVSATVMNLWPQRG